MSFIEVVSNGGCDTFIIHARKAILKGLSPKENRNIPPLNYERVHEIKRNFPKLNIIINGGFSEITQIIKQLEHVDGVMIGRAAYQNPFLLKEIDSLIFNDPKPQLTRLSVLREYKTYAEEQIKNGVSLRNLIRHIVGLYKGEPGARKYRQMLSKAIPKNKNNIQFFDEIIESIS